MSAYYIVHITVCRSDLPRYLAVHRAAELQGGGGYSSSLPLSRSVALIGGRLLGVALGAKHAEVSLGGENAADSVIDTGGMDHLSMRAEVMYKV